MIENKEIEIDEISNYIEHSQNIVLEIENKRYYIKLILDNEWNILETIIEDDKGILSEDKKEFDLINDYLEKNN